jgi:pantetheine-phosphate adenylyltransferase
VDRVAIYPGTFDPVTNGHIDILKRSLRIFDGVIMAVAVNPRKRPLFSIEKRVSMIKDSLKGVERVTVESFDGLLIDYVRGLRAVSDFEFELQMALMNRRLDSAVETVFMMPSQEYSFLTSTMVKEVASVGGLVKGLVPEVVERALREIYNR